MHAAEPEGELLRWQGQIVPWVTRWTGEVIREPLQVDIRNGNAHIFYADGQGNRDAFGVLWQREGVSRGGEPEFAQVSCYRQRTSMLTNLCQVCGCKIDVSKGYIDWLVPRALLINKGQDLTTTSPPTCSKCIKIALAACPHLKANDWALARVSAYTVWGVHGDIITRHKNRVRRKEGVAYKYAQNKPIAPPTAVLAKQQIVIWQRFDFIEGVERHGTVVQPATSHG